MQHAARNYAIVTAAYWGFTLTDGALRMLVLLHFYRLGYSPFNLAFLFLLYEAMAADAWPLGGGHFGSLEEFDSRLLCGHPTLQPRMTAVPVRMPFPKAPESASLYQSQKYMANRFFEVAR